MQCFRDWLFGKMGLKMYGNQDPYQPSTEEASKKI
jgi:hypothetical protein